ncbi:hypothetical protein FB451DRAFT_1445499 [Mycena latifolia]|nr:hypothetical protein FB451DRAFT_1445499 [Mycena latifolia]
MAFNSFNAVIFDRGDVMLSWSPPNHCSIPSGLLRRFLRSYTWLEYERGRISEDAEFSVQPLEVRNAFEGARSRIACNDELVEFIRVLKEQCHGSLQVFAMSNISDPDYRALEPKIAGWGIFDRVFTSSDAGERKPDLAFYPTHNILSARSLGLRGIVFDNSEAVKCTLQNLFGDPVVRGRQFLQRHAGRLSSVTTNGFEIQENFAQLLILEATSDRSLVNLPTHPRRWNFFQGMQVNPDVEKVQGMFTTEVFPSDLDTTSLALSILEYDAGTVQSVMDEMLKYVNVDGIVQTYFDHTRPRIDPVVCVNVLALTRDWVHAVLLHRAYIDGTRYYLTGESFLYFLMRFLRQSNDPALDSMFKPLLKQGVEERIGTPGDALALAMRVLVCDYVKVGNAVDLETLLALQCEDGGWEIGMYIGNRGLTTALAINAIVATRSIHRTASA